jgi:signal transduction histidine kinase
MTPLAEDAQSKISADIEENMPKMLADENEIIRVIINLINNAIKHNEKGTTIKVSARRTNDKIIVSVSDNGSGIPDSEKPKIFQRYPTAKRKIGTGLGLYLSKQIIDAHNGKIWFESELNKGTTFSFSLPINAGKN